MKNRKTRPTGALLKAMKRIEALESKLIETSQVSELYRDKYFQLKDLGDSSLVAKHREQARRHRAEQTLSAVTGVDLIAIQRKALGLSND